MHTWGSFTKQFSNVTSHYAYEKIKAYCLAGAIAGNQFPVCTNRPRQSKRCHFQCSIIDPVSGWITATDWEHPNIFKIDAAIAAYERNEIHADASKEERRRER
jgi:hypothetical protein